MIKEIAQAQQMSEKYISRLVIDLRKGGMIASVRGAQGGFFLAKKPKDISLLDTLETLEGPINIVECVRTKNVCSEQNSCSARQIWEDVNERLRESLNQYSLQDVIDKQLGFSGQTDIEYCV